MTKTEKSGSGKPESYRRTMVQSVRCETFCRRELKKVDKVLGHKYFREPEEMVSVLDLTL